MVNISSFIVDFILPLDKSTPLFFYFDANFFINSFTAFSGYKQKHHPYDKVCRSFLAKIDAAKKEGGNVRCYTSTFTLNELFWFIVSQDILRIVKEKKIIEKKAIEEHYKEDPTIIHDSFAKIKSIKTDLDAFPVYIIEPQRDISGDLIRLITEYDLLPADAYHIATAKSNGIDKIVAVDEDFGRPALRGEFTLFTPIYKLLHPEE